VHISNHGGIAFFPVPPLPATFSARSLGVFYIRAGTAVPLPTFADFSQKFSQTPGASIVSVQLRSATARSGGIHPPDFFHMRFAVLTALRGVPPR